MLTFSGCSDVIFESTQNASETGVDILPLNILWTKPDIVNPIQGVKRLRDSYISKRGIIDGILHSTIIKID